MILGTVVPFLFDPCDERLPPLRDDLKHWFVPLLRDHPSYVAVVWGGGHIGGGLLYHSFCTWRIVWPRLLRDYSILHGVVNVWPPFHLQRHHSEIQVKQLTSRCDITSIGGHRTTNTLNPTLPDLTKDPKDSGLKFLSGTILFGGTKHDAGFKLKQVDVFPGV